MNPRLRSYCTTNSLAFELRLCRDGEMINLGLRSTGGTIINVSREYHWNEFKDATAAVPLIPGIEVIQFARNRHCA